MTGRGVHTWAHITPFGANVLEVAAFPRHHIARLGILLDQEHIEWSPVLMDDQGQPTSLLLFSPDAYTDAQVAELTDRISGHDGFGALAHVSFHDHEVGHVHLFGPVGSPPADPYDAPVFIHGTVHTDGSIEVWLFGTHKPLLNVTDLMKRFFADDVDPVETPDGWTAATCTLKGAQAAGQYQSIEGALTYEGWDVHVRPLQHARST